MREHTKSKNTLDIDIRKVLMLLHLFQKYFEIIFRAQSVEAFEQDGRRNGQIRDLGSSF